MKPALKDLQKARMRASAVALFSVMSFNSCYYDIEELYPRSSVCDTSNVLILRKLNRSSDVRVIPVTAPESVLAE